MRKNKMTSNYEPLSCKYCGKNPLLKPTESIVIINEVEKRIIDVYVCCKGECDSALGAKHGWVDVSEFLNPELYLNHIFSVLNRTQKNGVTFDENALHCYKQILSNIAQYVFREMEDEEVEKAMLLKATFF